MEPSFDWAKHQATLPTLPLPTLEETCERYIIAVESLVTPEEMQGVKACLAQLMEPGSVGQQLHEELAAREKARLGVNTDETFVSFFC
jgi:carnitine O-acetyltransferase